MWRLSLWREAHDTKAGGAGNIIGFFLYLLCIICHHRCFGFGFRFWFFLMIHCDLSVATPAGDHDLIFPERILRVDRFADHVEPVVYVAVGN